MEPSNIYQLLKNVWNSGSSSLSTINPSNEFSLFKSIYDAEKDSLRVNVYGLNEKIQNNVNDQIDEQIEIKINQLLEKKLQFILNPVIKICNKPYITKHIIPGTNNKNVTLYYKKTEKTPSKEIILNRIEYVENAIIIKDDNYDHISYKTRKNNKFTIYKKLSYRRDNISYEYGREGSEIIYLIKDFNKDFKYELDNLLDILKTGEDYQIEYLIDNLKNIYPELFKRYEFISSKSEFKLCEKPFYKTYRIKRSNNTYKILDFKIKNIFDYENIDKKIKMYR